MNSEEKVSFINREETIKNISCNQRGTGKELTEEELNQFSEEEIISEANRHRAKIVWKTPHPNKPGHS